MKKKNNKIAGTNGKSNTQSKKQIAQTVRNLVEAEIVNLGYELWNVEYYNDGIEWLLEITLDKPGTGISLDDCEKVTHAINPIIDKADPIENSYSLAVSSPGLNRELKNAFHISRYIEKEVTVKLFAKNEITAGKTFNAVLKEYDETEANFKFELINKTKNGNENKTIVIAKKEIAHIYAYDEINYK